MKKTIKRRSRKEELQEEIDKIIPNREEQKTMISGLYQGNPLFGESGIFTDLLQRMVNLSLEGELESYLEESVSEKNNRKNGFKKKQVRSTGGMLSINTPHRNGEYEPIMVKNWERELTIGMDEIILSLYARGHSVEDVQQHLRQIYGVDISNSVISTITDKILPEITSWQNRSLASCYVVMYLDGIYYKTREDGKFSTKVIHTCYGITVNGDRDILGLYINESEGAKNWGLILEDLKRRGVEDVLFFCIDGLAGFKDALESVFPKAIVQRFVVHMIRYSTRFVSDRDMKAVCADLRAIYQSTNAIEAELALESCEEKWGKKYKGLIDHWRNNWDSFIPFLDYMNIRLHTFLIIPCSFNRCKYQSIK
jgi:putative transposase